MHVGIAGEFRCVITKADGKVKTDTGYQKNLILNQGLDFFGGGNGTSFNARCAIGTGNSAPAVTQNSLDAIVAIATGSDSASSSSYLDRGDNLYRTWQEKKYRFAGLNDVNISEVGLISTGSGSYYFTTRALIKDSAGEPTSISLKTGEILDIYYRIWSVKSTIDVDVQINMLDGVGGSIPYNCKARLKDVGASSNSPMIGQPMITNTPLYAFVAYPSELGSFTGSPSGSHMGAKGNISVDSAYVKGSYKRLATYNLALDSFNGQIRSVTFGTLMGWWQVRYGSVEGDNPITKTSADTLALPFEFSWARYEGEL